MNNNEIGVSAGQMLKAIAKKNGCKTNKAIQEKIGFSYEVVNRSLREDHLISPNFLKTFFTVFNVSFEVQKDIKIKIALAKADPILEEEFLKMKKKIKELKQATEISEAQEIMGKAFEWAIKHGIIDAFIKLKEK